MEFALTAEQKLLRETLRDFARRELLPNYASRDADKDLPPALARKLGELGLLAPMADAQLGGSKLDYVSLGIAHEEIARGDFNAAYVLLLAALVGAIISRSARCPSAGRVSSADLPGRNHRGAGGDRARRRLRCRTYHDASASRRRQLRPERRKNLHLVFIVSRRGSRPGPNRHGGTVRSRRQRILRRPQLTGRIAHALSRHGLARNRSRPAFFRRRPRTRRRSNRRGRRGLRRSDAGIRLSAAR